MSLEAWALFCLTETVLCLNPGPSALVVISRSLDRGSGAGIRAAVGVLAANAIYFALSASGLVALHSLSAEVFAAVRWGGAAYLVWLGARTILRSLREAQPIDTAPLDRSGRSFWRGFVAQGSNPNLLVYFTAILPQFIDPGAALPSQVGILAVSSFVIEFGILSGYAGVSGRVGEIAAPRFRATLERIGGGLLIAAAAGLARIERR